MAAILPETNRHILIFFISGSYSIELGKKSNEEVIAHFGTFLSKFVKEEVKIRASLLTRWHLDEHSLGAYSYCRPGHKQAEFAKTLSQPI